MQESRFWLRPVILAAALVLASAAVVPAAAVASATPSCVTVTIPVALAPGQLANQWVSGEYCVPAGGASDTIDVLVPGFSYDHKYWFGPGPAQYSFAMRTLDAGRAVLAIDRLGSGASSHPPSSQITDAASAYSLHQVIQWARQVQRYQRVDVIAHSLGSFIALVEAGTWPSDPDALVLTGLLHGNETADDETFQGDVYPAVDDPLFAGSGLDPGYLTTIPGVRGIYYAPGADPSVMAWDEANKATGSATELSGSPELADPPGSGNPSDAITAPVLIVMGQEDYFFCESAGASDCSSHTAVYEQEAPYYSSAASLTVDLIPGTGHDLALSPTAGRSFGQINSWLAQLGS
jgi:pimeloyl-ACP methyl ester carboxylesterase